MRLEQLADGIAEFDAATSVHEAGVRAGDIDVLGISVNSQHLLPGMMFCAVVGAKVDGRDFIQDALSRGAVAVLTNRPVDGLAVPVLLADDPRRALALMAARLHAGQPEVVAAVTGTAGKTSVASFLRQIWTFAGLCAGQIGTTGVFAPGRADYGSLTTPDPVRLHELFGQLARDGVTHMAMEASSHGLDQRRLDGVKLAVAGFTNLGRDHLDYHADLEEYLACKMRLFDTLLKPGEPAVINADDAFSAPVIAAATARGLEVLTVGHAGTFLALKRVEQHRTGQIGEIEFGERLFRVKLPLAGEFQMSNALVAAGMAIATGLDAPVAMKALESLQGAPGRLELVGSTAMGAAIYVDYAHKPEALENVLDAVRPYSTGRLVLVFGCGGDRDAGKRAIMGEIAARLADDVIVTDDNPRTEDADSIRLAIMAAVPGGKNIADRRTAIGMAIAGLSAGDTLVIAGKGHEEGQIVGDVTLPFSDHEVVRQALGKAA
ncbi:UDP-N-acetylmuramoyl-L-alanyl-D-glutamate--2,6-diaminopimelate ligase [Rhizobiaceae bacterium]|nr:UDP-N-acetylmuramoyl-L-alanyl-D-glutamate--2,6-diaminopimelate ligase [Rhizobiaceae bacterium]